ncbi:uncharacterized protein C8Q71DRAFT_762417 [Rhodofomes roseus]|uniref:Uncharacterized protein n=1 Tax=Rhodofomes roseus TaxID=34475 RepID=A0ABQ8KGI5_9APHY|nr:uncharacterized protein C8Q71DRAFT_762417 [Rhodofomes roseus]KAH9836401.1 hypothetical protein C8Q71DRAFT_762417 [Rhodofomes roseus]
MPRGLALYALVASIGLPRSTSVSAYSWSFTNTPQQCQNISLSLTGSGTGPYSVLVIPFGPSPLANNTEVRRIFEVQFSGTETSFQLAYPEDSQFVAVVSDSTGFGSGGTSVAATVQSSSDSSCYNPAQEVSPEFAFSIVPANQIVECSPTRIWWDPANVQGTPSFQGIIPGGQSFSIPESSFSTVAEQGYGFTWTPSVRIGTTVLLVGGDNRGAGTGGSGLYIVSQGPSQDCLNTNSPSSTPGSPAGGSYPTSTNGAGTGGTGSGSSSGHSNTGAIVGGVVGGVVGFLLALALVGLLLWRRRRNQPKARRVDLLQANSDEDGVGVGVGVGGGDQLPRYYEPEPFLLPEPEPSVTTQQMSEFGGGRRASGSTAGFLAAGAGRPGTPSSTTRTGKSAAQPSLRPVNIVQHEDAGPPPGEDDEDEEPETVELPPAYTNLKNASRPREEGATHEESPPPVEA